MKSANNFRRVALAKKTKRRSSGVIDISKINDSNYLRMRGIKHADSVIIAGFASVAIPVLLGILKAAAISGIAGAIAEPIKRRVTEPIITRIIGNLKEIIASKGSNETYTQTLWRGVKDDLRKLAEFFKKEASPLYAKVKALSNKAEQIK